VAGAFAVLAGAAGAAGLSLGITGRRQIRRSAGSVTGRGLATWGIACAASGLVVTVLALALSIATANLP